MAEEWINIQGKGEKPAIKQARVINFYKELNSAGNDDSAAATGAAKSLKSCVAKVTGHL